MVVLDSPFAALQLVGLMLPVVVLTLKAYVDPLRKKMSAGREKKVGKSSNEHKIERASKVAIVSLLAFIISALVVLAGQFVGDAVDATIVSLLWAVAVGTGFLGYAGVVAQWLYELMRPEKVEVV